ncbi:ninein-like protein isoform X5 [Neopelma chrysocephalum]|nr:ninein-like protein isoform X5 [Neopelma chrysocephalum]XP_027552814.1 ninein-like protein isoform X5 [Neopelma chrysocephalum]
MKQNTELQNKVTEMTEKLSASEELVVELQKELNHIVKEKLGQVEPHSPEFLSQSELFAEIVLEYERQCQRVKVLYDQNRALRRELQRLRLQLQESRAVTGLPARGLSLQGSSLPECPSPSPLVPTSTYTEMSLPVEQLQELKVQLETKINYYKEQLELMQKNFEREKKDSEESFKAEMHKMEDQKRDLEETVAKYWAVISSLKEQKHMWSLELEERFEVEQARVGQPHTEDICHPGQQLDQEGEELRTQQHQDRLSLRKHMNKLGREKVEELSEIAELTALSEKSKEEVSHPNVKVHQLGCELTGRKAGHSAGPGSAQLQSQRLAEAEWPRGAEVAARLEHHQKHAACWMEMELLQQQLKASQEKLLEAKASLSLAQTQHALQLQQAKAQMNNMVSKQQFEQLQTTLREEQCKIQQLQESLHQQAEQTCRQLVRTQAEHEHLLQAAVEQAEGLEHSLRSAEAMLAERAAQLRDAQAQLSRNKLLIEDLRGKNRGFAVALQAAQLKQKSTEEKNQLLEEQASALKQLIGKITPASLSG